MSTRASGHPLYISSEGEPLYGWLHLPPADGTLDVAVLMCSPFGWDETASYRSRRVWAERLAAAGYPTLRFDLPGTGDSGGSADDPNRVEAWTAAVLDTARWLRGRTGCRRLVAAGVGLGGILAARALVRGAPIDDLALWATPARGRALVREMRTFGAMEASARETVEQSCARIPAEVPQRPPLEDGAVESGGFMLSGETVRALEAVDVSREDIRAGGGRRALLLGRDGIAADARLRRWLEDAGVQVTTDDGEGFGRMTDQRFQAQAPQVVDRMTRWLGEEAGTGRRPPEARPDWPAETSAEVELEAGEGRIREELFSIAAPSGGRLEGVLAEPVDRPAAELCAIYANVGVIRRTGPGRMWVDTSRRWAARGVPCLRLDVAGIGDSEGDASRYGDISGLYVPELAEQIAATVTALAASGVARRFIIVGLCSSAYWGFHCALHDDRVGAVVMINPAALMWGPGLVAAREARRALRLRRLSQWRRLARGGVERELILRVLRGVAESVARAFVTAPARLAARWHRRRGEGDDIDAALDRLSGRDQRLVLVFCSLGEQLRDELARQRRLPPRERWPNMELELIPGYDHLVRPRAMQRDAHEILDRALERELERMDVDAHVAAGSI